VPAQQLTFNAQGLGRASQRTKCIEAARVRIGCCALALCTSDLVGSPVNTCHLLTLYRYWCCHVNRSGRCQAR
jgi:hypothetical protein